MKHNSKNYIEKYTFKGYNTIHTFYNFVYVKSIVLFLYKGCFYV